MAAHDRDPMSLAGQVALVTGASSGIGRAVALAMGAAGADVVVNYVSDPQAADAVADEVRAQGRRSIAVRADVSVEGDVEAMFEHATAELGTVHIVVCNAGSATRPWSK